MTGGGADMDLERERLRFFAVADCCRGRDTDCEGCEAASFLDMNFPSASSSWYALSTSAWSCVASRAAASSAAVIGARAFGNSGADFRGGS